MERHAAREAAYGVDVESVFGHRARDFGDVARGDAAAQQRDDVAVLALAAHPGVVVGLRNGREADHDAQLRSLEEQLLHDVARLVGGRAEQNSERQRAVDVGLADVEDECVVAGQYLRERRGHAGLVFARDVDLNDFDLMFHVRPVVLLQSTKIGIKNGNRLRSSLGPGARPAVVALHLISVAPPAAFVRIRMRAGRAASPHIPLPFSGRGNACRSGVRTPAFRFSSRRLRRAL